MAGDWVKLHRKILDSQVFASADLLKLWVLCLTRANFRDTFVPIDGVMSPVEVKRGQFITGRFELHRAYYPIRRAPNKSPSTVWRWLKALEGMRNLHIETNSRYSLVTVCNYERYQAAVEETEQPNEQQLNSRCTAGEQPVNSRCTQKKKDKKEEEGRRRKKKEESPDGDPPALTLDRLIKSWNKIDGVARCEVASKKRQIAFRQRVGDPRWVENVAEALELVAGSQFCRGDNDRSWRANMDWFLRPDTVWKIIERQYEDGQPAKPASVFTTRGLNLGD